MATTTAAGVGRKKPQLDINVERLELDPENPRLAEEAQGSDQETLLAHMFDHFDLDEIAESMGKNGYFDEEPLVVIPKSLPKDVDTKAKRSTEAGREKYKSFINSKDTVFVVAEGNRRLATAKLLQNNQLRAALKRGKSWTTPTAEVLKDIAVLPCIVYAERVDVLPYLGVRHITGNKKWDSYANSSGIAKVRREIFRSSYFNFGLLDSELVEHIALHRWLP